MQKKKVSPKRKARSKPKAGRVIRSKGYIEIVTQPPVIWNSSLQIFEWKKIPRAEP
jgi:hypothetical protein